MIKINILFISLITAFTFSGNNVHAKNITNTLNQVVGVKIYYKAKTERGTTESATDIIKIMPNATQKIAIPPYRLGYNRIIAGAPAPDLEKKLTEDLSTQTRYHYFTAPFGFLGSRHYFIKPIVNEKFKYEFSKTK